MKKVIMISMLFATLIIVSLFYAKSNDTNSYATPKEALINEMDSPWEMVEIIDTKILEDQDYAYVFFYSKMKERQNYFVVSEFKRNKNGWKFINMFGGGKLIESNANGSLYFGGVEDGEYYGLATSDVNAVKLGDLQAELIPLNKDFKIWIFYNPNAEDIKNDLRFLDKTGNEITP